MREASISGSGQRVQAPTLSVLLLFSCQRGVSEGALYRHMKLFLIFSILATVSFLSKINAQTSTATLDHNGELTAFNGTSSFAKAMEAASEGDAIYLSAGHYDATDITKPVSIKGTGFIDDKDNGLEASVIDFSVKINLPEEKGLTIEGIRFDDTIYIESELTSSLFLHCGFKGIKFSATTKNFSMNGCINHQKIEFCKSQENMVFNNSHFTTIEDESDGSSTIYFKNCNIEDFTYRGVNFDHSLQTATIENSVIINRPNNRSGITWIKTIIPSNSGYLPDGSQTKNCWLLSTDEINNLWDGDWWELKKEAAGQYIGTDNTQIGIYGGPRPFIKTVYGPRITQMVIPTETDDDGNIKISITVDRHE